MRDLTIDEVKTVAGAVDPDQVEFMTTQQFKASLDGGGGGGFGSSLQSHGENLTNAGLATVAAGGAIAMLDGPFPAADIAGVPVATFGGSMVLVGSTAAATGSLIERMSQ